MGTNQWTAKQQVAHILPVVRPKYFSKFYSNSTLDLFHTARYYVAPRSIGQHRSAVQPSPQRKRLTQWGFQVPHWAELPHIKRGLTHRFITARFRPELCNVELPYTEGAWRWCLHRISIFPEATAAWQGKIVKPTRFCRSWFIVLEYSSANGFPSEGPGLPLENIPPLTSSPGMQALHIHRETPESVQRLKCVVPARNTIHNSKWWI